MRRLLLEEERMAREGREVWAKRVQRWRESDLTAPEFAAEIGVNVNTLRSWSWKLGAAKDGRPRRPSGPRTERPTTGAPQPSGPSFVELTPALLSAPTLELVVGERFVVRVPAGFDATALRELVSTLEAMA